MADFGAGIAGNNNSTPSAGLLQAIADSDPIAAAIRYYNNIHSLPGRPAPPSPPPDPDLAAADLTSRAYQDFLNRIPAPMLTKEENLDRGIRAVGPSLPGYEPESDSQIGNPLQQAAWGIAQAAEPRLKDKVGGIGKAPAAVATMYGAFPPTEAEASALRQLLGKELGYGALRYAGDWLATRLGISPVWLRSITALGGLASLHHKAINEAVPPDEYIDNTRLAFDDMEDEEPENEEENGEGERPQSTYSRGLAARYQNNGLAGILP